MSDTYYRVICFDSDGNCTVRHALGLDKARKIADEYHLARIEPVNWSPEWLVDVTPCAWTGDKLDVAQTMGNA